MRALPVIPKLRATVQTVPPGARAIGGRGRLPYARASALTPAMYDPSPPASTTAPLPRAAMAAATCSRSARVRVSWTRAPPRAAAPAMISQEPTAGREPARLAVDDDVCAGAHLARSASTRREIGLRRGDHGERPGAGVPPACSRCPPRGGIVGGALRRVRTLARDAGGAARGPCGAARRDRQSRERGYAVERRRRLDRARSGRPGAPLGAACRGLRARPRRARVRSRARRRPCRSDARA